MGRDIGTTTSQNPFFAFFAPLGVASDHAVPIFIFPGRLLSGLFPGRRLDPGCQISDSGLKRRSRSLLIGLFPGSGPFWP